MIETRSLAKHYGSYVAIPGLDLKIERGQVFGFLGPNGAGKTTTIRMLMGVLVPTSGSAFIDGLDCQQQSLEVKRRVGYLPDNPIFYDYLRGYEIVEFVAEMHGLPRAQARQRAGQLLEEFQLGDAAAEFAVNYSMGMKKKLGLACAMVHDPPVLILDEPVNGLDPRATRQVLDMLVAGAERGKTILMSTHLLNLAERMCHRVGIIHHGRLVAEGVPGEFDSLEELYLTTTAEDDHG